MKKLLVFFLIMCSKPVWAQDKTDEAAYRAYISENVDAGAWESIVQTLHMEADGAPQNIELLFKLAFVQHGLLGSTMHTRNERLFDKYYDQTVENLKKIIGQKKNWAEPQALLSGTYGIKMGYSPFMGMFLGSKSDQLTQKALKLDPQSALAWKVLGMAKLHTPETWGGDIKQAVAALEKCVKLYESQPESLEFNWMYLDALSFLGQAYVKHGEELKAIAVYEKALNVEPDFRWVRDLLLPAARSKK